MQFSTSDAAAPRTGRPAMPREQIVAAALQLIDAHGAEKFSLRLLATELQSSTATLYRHFASKEALLAAAGELVLGEIRAALTQPPSGIADSDRGAGKGADVPSEPWREELFAMADALYRTFEVHPHMVAVLGDEILLGPNALALREHVLIGLLDAGFSPRDASLAFTSIMHYTLGFCLQLGKPNAEDGDAARMQHFAALDPALYPATHASAPFLPTALRDEFRFGLSCLVTGLESVRGR